MFHKLSTAHKLPQLLMFCTGVNVIPPLGFHDPDKITVLQFKPEDGPFPNASTCAMEMELPCVHEIYEQFRETMNTALNNQCSGFGIA